MAATVAAAAERGAAALWLGVNQQNARANRFYEKNGFRQIGIKHFQVGGRLEDDYVRELVFA
jgi:ribosomal protein S18 acetylase RimI-like enzyme